MLSLLPSVGSHGLDDSKAIISPWMTWVCGHYIDVITTTMASQIASLTVVYLKVYSDADKKHQSCSASLAFVWGIHWDRWIPRTKGQLRKNVSIWWRHHGDDLTREINVDIWHSILILDFMESRCYYSGRISFTYRSEKMYTSYCLNGSKMIALWKYEILHN